MCRYIGEYKSELPAFLTEKEGLDFREPLRAGTGAEAAYRLVRSKISHLKDDRILHYDINKARDMVLRGEVVLAVENVVGELSGI